MADARNGWNNRIIDEFRANEGKVGGYFAGASMVLIHHRGARTGTERVSPVVYLPDGDDMVIAATKGGHPQNPHWYHNLRAHPRITVEVGTETFPVEAVETSGAQRDELRRLHEARVRQRQLDHALDPSGARGHHDHARTPGTRLELAQHLQPVEVGHPDVEQHDARLRAIYLLQRLAAVRRRRHDEMRCVAVLRACLAASRLCATMYIRNIRWP